MESLFSFGLYVEHIYGLDVYSDKLSVGFRFLDYPTVIINSPDRLKTLDFTKESAYDINTDKENSILYIRKGKSCLFKSSFGELKTSLSEVPLYVMVLENNKEQDKFIGCCSIPLINVFTKLNDDIAVTGTDSPSACEITDRFQMYNLMGVKTGGIKLQLKLNFYGSSLLKHKTQIDDGRTVGTFIPEHPLDYDKIFSSCLEGQIKKPSSDDHSTELQIPKPSKDQAVQVQCNCKQIRKKQKKYRKPKEQPKMDHDYEENYDNIFLPPPLYLNLNKESEKTLLTNYAHSKTFDMEESVDTNKYGSCDSLSSIEEAYTETLQPDNKQCGGFVITDNNIYKENYCENNKKDVSLQKVSSQDLQPKMDGYLDGNHPNKGEEGPNMIDLSKLPLLSALSAEISRLVSVINKNEKEIAGKPLQQITKKQTTKSSLDASVHVPKILTPQEVIKNKKEVIDTPSQTYISEKHFTKKQPSIREKASSSKPVEPLKGKLKFKLTRTQKLRAQHLKVLREKEMEKEREKESHVVGHVEEENGVESDGESDGDVDTIVKEMEDLGMNFVETVTHDAVMEETLVRSKELSATQTFQKADFEADPGFYKLPGTSRNVKTPRSSSTSPEKSRASRASLKPRSRMEVQELDGKEKEWKRRDGRESRGREYRDCGESRGRESRDERQSRESRGRESRESRGRVSRDGRDSRGRVSRDGRDSRGRISRDGRDSRGRELKDGRDSRRKETRGRESRTEGKRMDSREGARSRVNEPKSVESRTSINKYNYDDSFESDVDKWSADSRSHSTISQTSSVSIRFSGRDSDTSPPLISKASQRSYRSDRPKRYTSQHSDVSPSHKSSRAASHRSISSAESKSPQRSLSIGQLKKSKTCSEENKRIEVISGDETSTQKQSETMSAQTEIDNRLKGSVPAPNASVEESVEPVKASQSYEQMNSSRLSSVGLERYVGAETSSEMDILNESRPATQTSINSFPDDSILSPKKIFSPENKEVPSPSPFSDEMRPNISEHSPRKSKPALPLRSSPLKNILERGKRITPTEERPESQLSGDTTMREIDMMLGDDSLSQLTSGSSVIITTDEAVSPIGSLNIAQKYKQVNRPPLNKYNKRQVETVEEVSADEGTSAGHTNLDKKPLYDNLGHTQSLDSIDSTMPAYEPGDSMGATLDTLDAYKAYGLIDTMNSTLPPYEAYDSFNAPPLESSLPPFDDHGLPKKSDFSPHQSKLFVQKKTFDNINKESIPPFSSNTNESSIGSAF